MKKLIVLLTLVMFTCVSYSQIKGINKKDAIIVTEDGQIEENFGKLIALKTPVSDLTYCIIYPQTAVGIKRCVYKVQQILSLNNRSLYDYDTDNSLFASFVDGIHDYGNLDLSISTGGSEVIRIWYFPNYDGDAMFLVLNEDMYTIYFNLK